ncbi:MAG: nucleotidyltransferase family protein, partial [Vulcanimicrobiaceae bacterium]
ATPATLAPPPAFAALAAATPAFERGEHAQGLARLGDAPWPVLFEHVARHKCAGLLTRWLEAAANASLPVPNELFERARSERMRAAWQAGRVLETAGDVRDRLQHGGIPAVFLKGAARLAAGQHDADAHYSGDVDVLVPRDRAGEAVAELRRAGYREHPADDADDEGSHHHRARLFSPRRNVPVELHLALVSPKIVSAKLDYTSLSPFVRVVEGPLGQVSVLDDVRAAVHLAYHARDFRAWRDIVLLARMLRTFDGGMRAAFEAVVRAERFDGVRVRSVVAVADLIAHGTAIGDARVRRYLRWALIREDLPRRLHRRSLVPEMLYGRFRREVDVTFWRALNELIALPAIVRHLRVRRAAGCALFEREAISTR